MLKSAARTQEGIAREPTISGPHVGRDRHGEPDHEFYRCEDCGLETTDNTVTEQGCFRCGSDLV